jgi:hypothetical protein
MQLLYYKYKIRLFYFTNKTFYKDQCYKFGILRKFPYKSKNFFYLFIYFRS